MSNIKPLRFATEHTRHTPLHIHNTKFTLAKTTCSWAAHDGASVLWAAPRRTRLVSAERTHPLCSERLSSILTPLDRADILPIGIHLISSIHAYLIFSMAANCDLPAGATFLYHFSSCRWYSMVGFSCMERNM